MEDGSSKSFLVRGCCLGVERDVFCQTNSGGLKQMRGDSLSENNGGKGKCRIVWKEEKSNKVGKVSFFFFLIYFEIKI